MGAHINTTPQKDVDEQSVRVNISMPRHVSQILHAKADQLGLSFSHFLAQSALPYRPVGMGMNFGQMLAGQTEKMRELQYKCDIWLMGPEDLVVENTNRKESFFSAQSWLDRATHGVNHHIFCNLDEREHFEKTTRMIGNLASIARLLSTASAPGRIFVHGITFGFSGEILDHYKRMGQLVIKAGLEQAFVVRPIFNISNYATSQDERALTAARAARILCTFDALSRSAIAVVPEELASPSVGIISRSLTTHPDQSPEQLCWWLDMDKSYELQRSAGSFLRSVE